jgi:hypothetical protein
MATKRRLISSFNGGEISRRMEGRVDLDGIYDRAVATMFNYVATVEGPALKRSGFRYIHAAHASSAWLTRFVFNTTQAYVLEWGEALLRFYTNGGQIESAPGVPYAVATPYTAAEARRVSTYQSFDRLYMAHASHPPASLLRTGGATFTYAAQQLRNGPFKNYNGDKSITVTVDTAAEAGGRRRSRPPRRSSLPATSARPS